MQEAGAYKNKVLQREVELQGYYREHFTGNNLNFWIEETHLLWQNTRKSKDSALYFRLLNYLSIICNMQSQSMIEKNEMDAAKYFLDIYEMADPDNPDVYFLKALYFANLDKTDLSLANLRKAVETGYNDLNRLQSEPAFESIRNKPGFKDLTETISK